MLKNVMFAAVATGLVVAVALPVQFTPAEAAAPLTCKEAAKLKYPADHAARAAYKKGCKEAWKAHKKATKTA
ncbi:MAG: hypothetical protein JJE37_12270 [Methyloceanibacter sp.]|jgi:hypothetical protein|nr:hypothetical protein [Methyloceanibacter sp.]